MTSTDKNYLIDRLLALKHDVDKLQKETSCSSLRKYLSLERGRSPAILRTHSKMFFCGLAFKAIFDAETTSVGGWTIDELTWEIHKNLLDFWIVASA